MIPFETLVLAAVAIVLIGIAIGLAFGLAIRITTYFLDLP